MHFHNFAVLHKTMFLSTWWCGGGGVVTMCVQLLRLHWLQPGRLLCLWDFPGKNTGLSCHFLFQGIFLTQGLNPCLLHCRWIFYHWATREALLSTQFGLFKTMVQWLIYIICRISLHAQDQFCHCRWPVTRSKTLLCLLWFMANNHLLAVYPSNAYFSGII